MIEFKWCRNFWQASRRWSLWDILWAICDLHHFLMSYLGNCCDSSDLPAHTVPLCPQCQGASSICRKHDGSALLAALSSRAWTPTSCDTICNNLANEIWQTIHQFGAETIAMEKEKVTQIPNQLTIVLALNQNWFPTWSLLQCVSVCLPNGYPQGTVMCLLLSVNW